MPTTRITSVPTTERVICGRSRMQVHFPAGNSFRSCVRILQIILLVLVATSAVYPALAQEPAQSSTVKTRTEKDLLGEKEVPANAYYGVQTERALENFQLSGVAINHYPGFVDAWAYVKLAAAQANYDGGAVKKANGGAIERGT